MVRLPTLKAEQLLAAMKKAGFKPTRQRGSHMRLRHHDGRVITVPIHPGKTPGLLRNSVS